MAITTEAGLIAARAAAKPTNIYKATVSDALNRREKEQA